MVRTIPVGPPATDIAPDSLIMLPPGFQWLNSVANWRTTWSHIVAGKFSDSPYSGLLCYDRWNGYAAFYETDGRGHVSLLQEYFNWRSSWTHVVSGVFGDSGYDGIFLYDQNAGFAGFYDTDGQGSLITLREYDDWHTSWTQVVVAPFSDSKYSGLLLYDQSTGLGQFYSTNRGQYTLLREYHGWLTTWTHIIPGKFYWDPPSKETPLPQFADLFFYDAASGYGETYSTDGAGRISLVDSQSGFPQTTDILAGNFGCGIGTQDWTQEWTNLLFYNRATQSGTIFARGDNWLPVEPVSPATPLPSTITLGAPLQGRRPPPPRPWTLFVTGNFWMPDGKDSLFGTSGRYPQYRYFYNGGFTDFLFYDATDGYAEFYLKEPSQPTPLEPLAGYISPRSALPGETVSFYVSSQVGAYTIDVYRQGAGLIYMFSVPIAANAARPYGISRTAYRDGARWPEVAQLTIPRQWPSGLYLARVRAGGFPVYPKGPGTVIEPAVSRATQMARPSSARPAIAGGVGGQQGPRWESPIIDIPFVVRSATPGSQARILLAVADTTYEAYNWWGGRSLYGHGCTAISVEGGDPTSNHVWVDNDFMLPRAFRVSFRRPFQSVVGYKRLQTFEVPLIQWMERHGFRAEVCVVSDLHKLDDLLQNYRLVVSVGHDEYWSEEMRDNVEKFVTNGGNAAFFSGNICWWRVRFEDDGNTMVCYKNKDWDPETILWRDQNRSSASMTGVSGDNEPGPGQFFTVEDDAHWAFNFTGLGKGDNFGCYVRPDGTVGSVVGPETDVTVKDSPDPQKVAIVYQFNPDKGQWFETGTMVTFQKGSGTVFTASTINWALGLSQDGGWGVIDQITWNVLNQLTSS